MTNKELYSLFCEQEALPLFLQPWWLDAVCAGSQWDALICMDKEGKVVAAMPYMLRSHLRRKYITMPQTTPFSGVWIRHDQQANADTQRQVAQDIAAQLAALGIAYYAQRYTMESPLPVLLKQQEFKMQEKNTYRLYDTSDLDKVLDSFSKNKKRLLQKSLTLHTDSSMEAEDFYRFYQDCLLQKGKKTAFTREFFLVLQRKAARQNQCAILRVRNAAEETLAAAFLLWDEHTLYYHISAVSPAATDEVAASLLVWEAVKVANQKGLQFDFCVNTQRRSASDCKQYGAKPYTLWRVQKYYKPLFKLFIFFQWLRGAEN